MGSADHLEVMLGDRYEGNLIILVPLTLPLSLKGRG